MGPAIDHLIAGKHGFGKLTQVEGQPCELTADWDRDVSPRPGCLHLDAVGRCRAHQTGVGCAQRETCCSLGGHLAIGGVCCTEVLAIIST